MIRAAGQKIGGLQPRIDVQYRMRVGACDERGHVDAVYWTDCKADREGQRSGKAEGTESFGYSIDKLLTLDLISIRHEYPEAPVLHLADQVGDSDCRRDRLHEFLSPVRSDVDG